MIRLLQSSNCGVILKTMDVKNTYGVIIVGSGLAGLTAGIASAEAGAKTIILEKMEKTGGSSAFSVGAFAVCGSAAQKRAGITDTPGLFYDDIMKCGEGYNVPELVKAMAVNSAAAFRFLTDRGAEYGGRLFAVDGHSVLRCFQPPAGLGHNVMRPLKEHFLKLDGAEIRLGVKVTGLIKDGENAVSGVETSVGPFFAEKGVVFAHGGFERDFFREEGAGLYRGIPTSAHEGATSETMRMLSSCGIKTCHTEFIRFGTSIAYNDIEKGMLADIRSSGRFISEAAPRRILTDSIIEAADGRYWPVLIFDSDGIGNISNDEKLEAMIEKGELQRFSCLNELAGFFGMDKDALSAGISRYNRFVGDKNDADFGKDMISSGAGAVAKAPFYACVVYPKLNYTQGGILINDKAMAVGSDGIPVKGLFAAGEATGGVHGKVRLTGCSTVDCAVFGIIAGRNAAAGRADAFSRQG